MTRNEGYNIARKMLIARGRLKKDEKLYYREDDSRPRTEAERLAAVEKMKELAASRRTLAERLQARAAALCEADAEYQQIKAELKTVKTAHEATQGATFYRVELTTVDKTIAGFHISHVLAAGTNWQHLIDRLEEEKK